MTEFLHSKIEPPTMKLPNTVQKRDPALIEAPDPKKLKTDCEKCVRRRTVISKQVNAIASNNKTTKDLNTTITNHELKIKVIVLYSFQTHISIFTKSFTGFPLNMVSGFLKNEICTQTTDRRRVVVN